LGLDDAGPVCSTVEGEVVVLTYVTPDGCAAGEPGRGRDGIERVTSD
jgi:hypothetical protein